MVKKGFVVNVQSKAGEGSFITDDEYIQAGANIAESATQLYDSSNLIIKVNPPEIIEECKHEIDLMKKNTIFISFIQTTKDIDIVQKLQAK